MILLSRLALAVLSVLALASILPGYVAKMFPRDYVTTIMGYSDDQQRLIFRNYRGGRWSYNDNQGNSLTEQQMREALPFAHMRELKQLGRLPEKVGDWTFDADNLARHGTRLRLVPRYLDQPDFRLYTLLESVPGPGGLVMPPDLFRMGQRIEFIDADSNRIDADKTDRFNQALTSAGFVHPARLVGDDGNTRKPRDHGALLVDAEGRVFHLWQIDGEPEVIRSETLLPTSALSIRVLQLPNREYHGLVTLPDQHLLLDWQDYAARPLPLTGHDATREFVAIDETPLHWELSWSRDGSATKHFVLADRQLQPVLQHTWHEDTADVDKRALRANSLGFLFPFKLAFRQIDNSQRNLYFSTFDANWMVSLAGVVSALATYLLWSRRQQRRLPHALDWVFILCTGWLGAITLAVLGPLAWRPTLSRKT